jgi:PTH1 family peptidyl-tRNA hydrolase
VATERWLIAGLGNPGPEYSHNRHNVGYWCINRLARLHGINLRAKTLAAIGEGDVRGVPVVLVKPRTYVNRSGDAVGPALRRWNVDPRNMVIIYDELDLPAGRIRIKAGGGSGGHNGIKSIIAAAGTQDFARIRVGIGRPHVEGKPTWDPKYVADWVLSDPSPEMVRTLQDAASRATEAVEAILTEGVETAANRYTK